MIFTFVKAICAPLDIKNLRLPASTWGSVGALQIDGYCPRGRRALYHSHRLLGTRGHLHTFAIFPVWDPTRFYAPRS